jgi:hypothetical protein
MNDWLRKGTLVRDELAILRHNCLKVISYTIVEVHIALKQGGVACEMKLFLTSRPCKVTARRVWAVTFSFA